MASRRAFAAALLSALTACARESADAADFLPVADVKQLMTAVVEPAAETYWDAVGWIIDAAGTHAVKPETAEAWDSVRNAAFVVAESGNLLMIRGRAMANPPGDAAAWAAYSRALAEMGRRAIAAAEARDPDAVFVAGGDLYEACTACHAAFAQETLRPSHQR